MVGQPRRNFVKMASWSKASEHLVNPIGMSDQLKWNNQCDTCRVAMFDETFPYIIPLNFGTDLEDNQLYLYFHGAKIGKKIDLMKQNKNVSFEMASCSFYFLLII